MYVSHELNIQQVLPQGRQTALIRLPLAIFTTLIVNISPVVMGTHLSMACDRMVCLAIKSMQLLLNENQAAGNYNQSSTIAIFSWSSWLIGTYNYCIYALSAC
jgi:hypothetical protein